jgi:hypothetical protein
MQAKLLQASNVSDKQTSKHSNKARMQTNK